MKRTLLLALAMTGLAANAHAADMMPSVGIPFVNPAEFKDPLPDTLTFYGVTFYATVDVGYAFQTNGRPLGNVVSTLEFIPFTTTRNYTGQHISTIAANGLSQSIIGVRWDEALGLGWNFLGRADTGIDPLTGRLSDGCSSFVVNAGLVYTAQNSNADSGRCGQAFNGQLYAGVSNTLLGRLTIGRQNSFQLDAIGVFDPLQLSYAFSLLGYSGTDGGSGSTQAARWDNSAKYVFEYGPASGGAMYSPGGSGTGFFGPSYSFYLAVNYQGFAAEGTFTREGGAVNLQSAINDITGNPNLAANISDDTEWGIMAKYTFEFNRYAAAPPIPTKEAKPAHGDLLTFYAGYTNTKQQNPHTPILFGDAAGNYPLLVGPNNFGTVVPDNNAFTTPKVLQFYWTGARYELPWGLSFTVAYYHVDQNQYVADGSACVAGGASKLDCAGTFDQGSFLVDYAFTKHFDIYAGVTYGIVRNGLASTFPGTPGAKFGFAGTGTSVNTTSAMTGLRVRI
jgi:predicted porin